MLKKKVIVKKEEKHLDCLSNWLSCQGRSFIHGLFHSLLHTRPTNNLRWPNPEVAILDWGYYHSRELPDMMERTWREAIPCCLGSSYPNSTPALISSNPEHSQLSPQGTEMTPDGGVCEDDYLWSILICVYKFLCLFQFSFVRSCLCYGCLLDCLCLDLTCG